MANSPDRHHSQTTHAAKLHCIAAIAAKQSRVVANKGIVPPYRQQRLKRFCGLDCLRITHPIR